MIMKKHSQHSQTPSHCYHFRLQNCSFCQFSHPFNTFNTLNFVDCQWIFRKLRGARDFGFEHKDVLPWEGLTVFWDVRLQRCQMVPNLVPNGAKYKNLLEQTDFFWLRTITPAWEHEVDFGPSLPRLSGSKERWKPDFLTFGVKCTSACWDSTCGASQPTNP